MVVAVVVQVTVRMVQWNDGRLVMEVMRVIKGGVG